MRNVKRIAVSLLLMFTIVILFCESEDFCLLVATKVVAFFCCFLIFALWRCWKMGDDRLVKKLTEE